MWRELLRETQNPALSLPTTLQVLLWLSPTIETIPHSSKVYQAMKRLSLATWTGPRARVLITPEHVEKDPIVHPPHMPSTSSIAFSCSGSHSAYGMAEPSPEPSLSTKIIPNHKPHLRL